jgi:hypothetical protein
MEERLPDNCNL